MRGEVLGVERRRRWNDDDKLVIVSSVGIDGATVTHVAHRHDVMVQITRLVMIQMQLQIQATPHCFRCLRSCRPQW